MNVIQYTFMSISLIIPTLNAGTHMEHLLSMLSSQDTKASEIIIIDSSSEDNTVQIARRFGATTMVIPRKDFNHGRTRNVAALHARGEILVFMTQDALPSHKTLLGTLTAPLRSVDVAATYGRQIPRSDASPLEKFIRQFNYPDMPMTKAKSDIQRYGIKTFFLSNVCSAVKKDAFLRVGMFPEGVRANEDMILAAKLILNGHTIAYVPDAEVMHSHCFSLFKQFRRYYNIGSSLKNNRWILNYAGAEGEGLRFIKEQVLFVLKGRRYRWIPYIALESMVKYAGYRMGLIAG
jgi:rhamnosyltransferase